VHCFVGVSQAAAPPQTALPRRQSARAPRCRHRRYCSCCCWPQHLQPMHQDDACGGSRPPALFARDPDLAQCQKPSPRTRRHGLARQQREHPPDLRLWCQHAHSHDSTHYWPSISYASAQCRTLLVARQRRQREDGTTYSVLEVCPEGSWKGKKKGRNEKDSEETVNSVRGGYLPRHELVVPVPVSQPVHAVDFANDSTRFNLSIEKRLL
jgi:hypothetical protein